MILRRKLGVISDLSFENYGGIITVGRPRRRRSAGVSRETGDWLKLVAHTNGLYTAKL